MHSEEIESPKITGAIFIEEKCISCGWCEDVCPAGAAKVSKPFKSDLVASEELTVLDVNLVKIFVHAMQLLLLMVNL